jgi:hypothetical protein
MPVLNEKKESVKLYTLWNLPAYNIFAGDCSMLAFVLPAHHASGDRGVLVSIFRTVTVCKGTQRKSSTGTSS